MEFVSGVLAQAIWWIGGIAGDFWQNMQYSNVSFWQAALDILLVAIIIYYLISLIKGSRALSILSGLLVISLVFVLSRALNLLTLSWIMDRFLTVLLVAIPIIFQPELRSALEKLGNRRFLAKNKAPRADTFVEEVVDTVFYLASKKIGALLVFQKNISLKEYADNGIAMDSRLSKELLVSIFQNKSPLHDGAVIVESSLIRAAGCTLPTIFDNRSKAYGTRHKAAIALSEQTDALVVVVSEERGTVSVALEGQIQLGLESKSLEDKLEKFLNNAK